MRDRAASTSGPECRSACDRRSTVHCPPPAVIASAARQSRAGPRRAGSPRYVPDCHRISSPAATTVGVTSAHVAAGVFGGDVAAGELTRKRRGPPSEAAGTRRQTPCRADVHRSRVSACHLGADPGFCILASSAKEGFGIKSASTRSIVPMRGGTASTSGPESRSSSESRCRPSSPSPLPVPVPRPRLGPRLPSLRAQRSHPEPDHDTPDRRGTLASATTYPQNQFGRGRSPRRKSGRAVDRSRASSPSVTWTASRRPL